jgi:serine phosphatase RsbU (regulator of sigma subunit)
MLGATLDLAEVMTRLLDLIFDLVPARRGTILLLDRASKKLRATVSKVRGQDTRRGAHVAVSRTIVREALRTREAILTLDAQADERFLTGESIAAAGIRSALCAPIVRQRRILGAVHLDTMSADRSFSRGDVDLLAGIVGVAALAIENARLYQQAAERERLRYELQLAHDIQQRLLPKTAPKARGLSVFGLMQPAREVGGDLYDFVGEADGSLHMFVGDVSGKGVGAGLIMAMARSYFRPLTSLHTSPRDVMIEMNRLLFQDTQADKFMSAVYLHWDAESQSLRYCGAGQEHLLIYRARTGTCEAIPAGGVALAVIEDASPFLEDQTLPLEPGDAVVMYTDGATEARDASGEFFQLERLQPLVTEFGGDKSAHAIVAKIVDRLQTWVGRAEPHDDLTLVALKRLPQ